MAIISFSQSSFDVVENETVIVVDLVRSGDTTSEVVVLIGSHPHQGSATVVQSLTCKCRVDVKLTLKMFIPYSRICICMNFT